MFLGREKELKLLDHLYSSDRFECLILYGRRRVGKTSLINAFVQDKKTIYFTGTDSTAQESLAGLSQSIYLYSHMEGEGPVYADFEAALDAIGELGKGGKLVVVFDEYPYLAKSYPPFSSILQKKIDLLYEHNSNIKMIICGSSMSFMEYQVLGYQSPLYGRRTAQLKLLPFSFFDTAGFFPNYSAKDRAVIYGVTGGIPKYMALMNQESTVEQNITEQFFDPSGYLYEEPENLLKQELREPAVYNAIIKAVAGGCSKQADITSAVKMDPAKIQPYLIKLIELGILTKSTPALEERSKKTLYHVADGMFRFWYLTVPRQNQLIQRGFSNLAYSNSLPSQETFMGGVFEDICTDYLWHIYPDLPVPIETAGRWWGADPSTKKTEEIDIVAGTKEEAIFCECKWRSKEMTANVLETLIRRSYLLDVKKRHYILFSKEGFSSGLKEAAQKNNVWLISFEEMEKIQK